MPVILNIEMPSCCNDCPCMYDMIICQALENKNHIYEGNEAVIDIHESRLPNCPLMEVKES